MNLGGGFGSIGIPFFGKLQCCSPFKLLDGAILASQRQMSPSLSNVMSNGMVMNAIAKAKGAIQGLVSGGRGGMALGRMFV